MAYRKGYYRKDGTYVQGHFTNSRTKKKITNNNKGCIILIVFFAGILTMFSCSEDSERSNCPTKNCSDFTSQ